VPDVANATPVSLEDLVGDAELVGISTFQLAAERVETPSDLEESTDVEPTHILHVETREDNHGYRIKVETQIEMPVGRVVATVGAAYELREISTDSVDREVLISFVNNVTVMSLIPYIRQAIGDITLRVFDSALLMPMMKRGELWFENDSDAAE